MNLIIFCCILFSSFIFKFGNCFTSRLEPRSRAISLNDRSANLAEYASVEEIERYASVFGLRLNTTITGPLLRIDVSTQNTAETLGYLTAFIRPWPLGLLQLDTVQVKNRRQWKGYKRDGWKIEGRGITFILGLLALNFGMNRGCNRAELLAVKDDLKMHAILVRLYESFGYKVVRNVGDDLSSVADRLVWGAVGTLMAMDIAPSYKIGTKEVREFLQAIDSKDESSGESQ
eukprot:gene9039-18720_t